jgi:hypothetical protein
MRASDQVCGSSPQRPSGRRPKRERAFAWCQERYSSPWGHRDPATHLGSDAEVAHARLLAAAGSELVGGVAHCAAVMPVAKALDDAHAARTRLGDEGESDVIGPDDIDKLREPAKRLAAWRRLITETVQSVTVAPAMTADGRPSRLWDPRRIEIRFLGQHP